MSYSTISNIQPLNPNNPVLLLNQKIDYLNSGFQQPSSVPSLTNITGGAHTYTAAELLNRYTIRSALPSNPVTDTMPTAAQIVTALNNYQTNNRHSYLTRGTPIDTGFYFDWTLVNNDTTDTLAVNGNTGVTFSPSSTLNVLPSSYVVMRITVTNITTPAVSVSTLSNISSGGGSVPSGTFWGDYLYWNPTLGGGQWVVGSPNVTLGRNAGQTSQGSNAVAIGVNAGQNAQGTNAVAVGCNAGQTSQGGSSVAVGLNAGQNAQGTNAIAIGTAAGQTSQHARSIIINAQGTALNSANTDALYVAPIRSNSVIPLNTVVYDNTTKEVSYMPTSNVVLNVSNVAALRALSVSSIADGTTITTDGYYTSNDGGQGSYIYSSSSAATDNGGTVIQPTSGSGRYLLSYGNTVSVKQFGAKADGVTNDTVSLQNAFAWALPIGMTLVLSGSYLVSASISSSKLTNNNPSIICENDVTITVSAAATPFKYLFNFYTSNTCNVTIEGGTLTIECNNVVNNAAFYIRTDELTVKGIVSITTPLTIKNVFNNSAVDTEETNVILVYGYYQTVLIQSPSIIGVNRTNPSGVCKGISVVCNGTTTINSPYVQNVLTPSTTDADGIACFGFIDVGSNKAGTAFINDPVIVDCMGRSIKFQIENATANRPVIKRQYYTTIPQGVDIDFQIGGEGSVIEPTIEYKLNGGVSPLGANFIVVAFQHRSNYKAGYGKILGGFVNTECEIPNFVYVNHNADSLESYTEINGVSFVTDLVSAVSPLSALMWLNMTPIQQKTKNTNVAVNNCIGNIQCPIIGYSNFSGGLGDPTKLTFVATNNTNTSTIDTNTNVLGLISGSVFYQVKAFLINNNNNFKNQFASSWIFSWSTLMAGCIFNFSIPSSATITNPPNWGTSGTALIECTSIDSLGNRSVRVTKNDANALNNIYYTVSSGTTWGPTNIAIGYSAGSNGQSTNAISIGSNAGCNNQGTQAIAIGANSGQNTQGSNSIAVGAAAGSNSQGSGSVAIGTGSGRSAQGANAIAIGSFAGCSNQNAGSIAIGNQAGFTFCGTNAIAIGTNAGFGTQGAGAVAIGSNAGLSNQGNASVAIGLNAGSTGEGASTVAIGNGAGQSNQGANAVAVGCNAGQLAQALQAVAIGSLAGQSNQSCNSVAIGYNSMCNNPSTTGYQISVGYAAGRDTQGYYAVAIGGFAGFSSQGNSTVAVGYNAGSTGQGIEAISVGRDAGRTSQGTQAIAIGSGAGGYAQGSGAVAVGVNAGSTGQGTNSISIGYRAGQTNQAPNSIVICASGTAVNGTTASSTYIAPIRNVTFTNTLGYDPVNFEVVYSSKTFVIDHPKDDKKYLVHACLEGPEAGVYYRGIGEITNERFSTVELPDYAVNFYDYTVQLTPIVSDEYDGDSDLKLYSTIVKNGKFKVFGKNTQFYWTVFGRRKSLLVEPSKDLYQLKGDGPYTYLKKK